MYNIDKGTLSRGISDSPSEHINVREERQGREITPSQREGDVNRYSISFVCKMCIRGYLQLPDLSACVIAGPPRCGEDVERTQIGWDQVLPRCKALSQRTPAERVPQVGAHCRQSAEKGTRTGEGVWRKTAEPLQRDGGRSDFCISPNGLLWWRRKICRYLGKTCSAQ